MCPRSLGKIASGLNTVAVPDIKPIPPRSSGPALAAIRAAGGDELVQAMASAFTGFAEAQWKWLDEQAGSHSFEAVHIAARSLRVSAEQVGAVDLADACGAMEIAAAGRDAVAVATTLMDVEREIANARPWMEALASE
jgi:HPt (histidine-containing phosphotransfer) domain-containing protein